MNKSFEIYIMIRKFGKNILRSEEREREIKLKFVNVIKFSSSISRIKIKPL